MGFLPTISDPRIYVKFYDNGDKAFISVHVDDLGIAASNMKIINDIKIELSKIYKLEFNADFNYYLGMLIWRDRPNRIIKVSQPGYILDLIETFNIDTKYKPLTPMVDVPRQIIADNNPLLSTEQQTEYQSKIGSCLWIVNSTRPDCLFAINILSRYTHLPTLQDMKSIDRLIQYIARTPAYGLAFSSKRE